MANELPPHITLAGSSGMGPIPATTPVHVLREKLEPIAQTTAPITAQFLGAHRFMQTDIVVLPLDPHGPVRELHERIRRSGLPYEQPRFTFTPHCTLNFYRELPPDEMRALLAFRVEEPVTIERIDCYRTVDVTRTEKVLELPLGA